MLVKEDSLLEDLLLEARMKASAASSSLEKT